MKIACVTKIMKSPVWPSVLLALVLCLIFVWLTAIYGTANKSVNDNGRKLDAIQAEIDRRAVLLKGIDERSKQDAEEHVKRLAEVIKMREEMREILSKTSGTKP